MSKKYEFKGKILEDFKKALKALADSASDEPTMCRGGKSYTPKQTYEEVEQQTEFGIWYVGAMELLCNESQFSPQELFARMYRDVHRYEMAKKAELTAGDPTYLLFEQVYHPESTDGEPCAAAARHELKGELLKEFKKALKALADAGPDVTVAHSPKRFYEMKDLYEAVEQQTEFGKEFTKSMEARCNFDKNFTPDVLIEEMYHYADRIKKDNNSADLPRPNNP